MKTVLITGIGGLTPRSIATIIKVNHPDYRLIGCDIDSKAVGFFMKGLVDANYIAPHCNDIAYFSWLEELIEKEKIDYAFVQPETEIVQWGCYFDKHGMFPCPVFMGCKLLSESLRDKSIMADLLYGTEFIPKTIKVTQNEPKYDDINKKIGFPCWIRATKGTGGLGSLRLNDINCFKSWLFINSDIQEFTVSEYLPGRHLANQMLYYKGEYIKGAALECVDYVMANSSPSHVTGNTHYGRFLNEDHINKFCDRCVKYLEKKLGVFAHGVLSFDLKEDANGHLKVTEINIRHMAYTGVMARLGFDLIEDTIKILEDGNCDRVKRNQFFHFDKSYVFLRDVDIEPIILEKKDIDLKNKCKIIKNEGI